MDELKTGQELFEELASLRASEAFFRRIVEQLPLPIELFRPKELY